MPCNHGLWEWLHAVGLELPGWWPEHACGAGSKDADAVGEGEAAVHGLGRSGLAVHEVDPADRAGVVARPDPVGADHDPDVGVEEVALPVHPDPERGAGPVRLRSEGVPGRGLEDVAEVGAVASNSAMTPLITLDT